MLPSQSGPLTAASKLGHDLHLPMAACPSCARSGQVRSFILYRWILWEQIDALNRRRQVTIKHWARTMEPGRLVVKPEHQDADDESSFEHVSHVERVCLHNLLDSTNEAIYFKDLHNRFLLVSKGVVQHHVDRERKNGATEKLDWGPEYYVGKTDLDLFDAALAAEWMAEEQRMIETAEPMVDVLERDSSDTLGGLVPDQQGPVPR